VKSEIDSPIHPTATIPMDIYPAISQRDNEDIRASISNGMLAYVRFENITAWFILAFSIFMCAVVLFGKRK
jgi:hypothetical protein